MAQARLREALNAGGPGTKEKGPPVADGLLSVTPDTPEAIEFRTRRSIFDSVGASSSYLEDETGPKPSELYGKFTWKIENFSEIGKRELRSTVFEVGSYKWYILVYPQGCDVCNHLSLFLCVADYDKLLPGWSHFAQFTIAVVNKDPKKSKYSDTLHRFCKKEHDWGWKKFMELNKVLEGFTVNNTLVIKAQVQVIRDRPSMPFRCLDAQYRRELVRVYLTNVETICRKFVEEKREALGLLRDDSTGFRQFWNALDPKKRRSLATEKGDVILKGVVKRFFNEKEVTSTLVMDALFSGCKQLEEYSRLPEQRKGKRAVSGPSVVINADKNVFGLMGDMMGLLERAATETIPPFRPDDKAADALTSRNAQDTDDYSKDYIERDERRLADLGRRAVEIFAVSHVFKRLQESHSEAESIKRQDALIKEEEEAERLEDQRQAARTAADRERKARKKERRRAKKEEDDAKRAAEEAERKQQEHVARMAQQEATERRKKEEKDRQAVATAAAGTQSERQESGEGISRQGLQQALAAGKAQRSAQAFQAIARPASTTSLASNSNAAARGGEAETTGRADSEDEPLKSGRRAANNLATARSSAEASDADDEDEEDDEELTSSSSPSATDEAIGSYRQLRGHIEFLESELARSTSELNTTRSELASTKEALAEAQVEVEFLRGELGSAKAELTGRAVNLPQRESERSAAPPSAPSVASSYSALNAVDVSSIISSTDGESPSRAGSLDLSQEPSALRGGAPLDSTEPPSSGTSEAASVQTTGGPPPPPPYNRRTNWNGTPSSAQENHASAHPSGAHSQGQASAANLATNARSKSGQLAGGRQPPPPPPAEQRAGANARGASIPRQASAPVAKESNSGAPRSQARAASLQSGQAPPPSGNGVHTGGSKRPGHHQHQQHESSRLGKNKTSLNGNAPSFVPQTSGAPPAANGTQGAQAAMPNGHHLISYRNVAAGLVISTTGSNDSSELSAASGAVPNGGGNPGSQGSLPLPPQVSTGEPRGGVPTSRASASGAASSASIPPTPRSVTLEGPGGGSPVAMNGNGEGSFSPTSYGVAHGQHSMQFSSPMQPKKAEQGGPAESPGLDDFAHMGLITDLLE